MYLQVNTVFNRIFLYRNRWEAEQKRLSVKRPYDFRGGRDVFWTEAKRPVVTETRFASKSTFTLDR